MGAGPSPLGADVTEGQHAESAIGEGECMQMLGPLSVPGQLRLTTDRLTFTPNRFNRIFGLKASSVEFDDIDSVELVGIDRVLQISAGNETLKFHGKWARTIHERLTLTLNADSLEMKALMNERILMQAAAEYYPSALVAVVGTVTVTTRSVRFEPRDLERLVYRSAELTIPVSDLVDVELRGPRKVALNTGDELRFASPEAPRLYATLHALVRHVASGDNSSEFYFDVCPAQYRGIVLSRNGLLSVTNQGLQFVAKGTLGIKDGVSDIYDWLFDEVTGLRQDRSSNRLLVATESQTHTLVCTELDARGEAIVQKYADSDVGPLPFYVEKANISVADGAQSAWAILNNWAYRFPDLDEQKLLMFGPATLVSPRPGTRHGWCVLFEYSFIWLPRGGPDSGINPVELDLGELLRADDENEEENEDEIRFRYRGRSVRLIASEGRLFTRPFWSVVEEQRAKILGLRPGVSAADARKASSAEPDERRETYRTTLTHRRRRETVIAHEDQSWTGELTNVSLHGCCVQLSESVESGLPVVITITENDGGKAVFHGHAIHCRQSASKQFWLCGIKFDGVWEEQNAIRSLWTRYQREEARESKFINTGEFPRLSRTDSQGISVPTPDGAPEGQPPSTES